MFLLTEATLFFLNLALDARIRDKKPSLRSVVQAWANEVAAATDDLADGATSESTHRNIPASSRTSFPVDHPCEGFASRYTVKQYAERSAMGHYCKVSVATPRIATRQPFASRAVKRKIDDPNVAFDIVPGGDGDDDMDVWNVCGVVKTTTGTFSVNLSAFRPWKRIKLEDLSAPNLALNRIFTPCMPIQSRVIDEGYIIRVIKRCCEYTNEDLPVPCDRRWTHSFISTAILWYSVQKDIWDVPKEELTSALQRIFDVVYPHIKYKVTPVGAVFAVTLQRIQEWRNSFGSSALAMMLHFFSSLDDDGDIHHVAKLLATDYRFLREDPDASESTAMFRSPFFITLLATTYLGDIAAFVDVPGWDTCAMAAGKGGDGVIAIASAALERAVKLFCDGTLDVDHILSEIAHCADAPSVTGTFSKTMLDTLAPPALRFSSANWNSHTAAYREVVRGHGEAFVRGTFAAARRRRITVCTETDASMSGDA